MIVFITIQVLNCQMNQYRVLFIVRTEKNYIGCEYNRSDGQVLFKKNLIPDPHSLFKDGTRSKLSTSKQRT